MKIYLIIIFFLCVQQFEPIAAQVPAPGCVATNSTFATPQQTPRKPALKYLHTAHQQSPPPHALSPTPYALCPLPSASCPTPYALCPLPSAPPATFSLKQKLIMAGLTAHQLGMLYTEYKWWWQGDYQKFKIYSDGWFSNYSLGVDKAGHFFTSYMYFHALNELLRWGDFSTRTRLIVSTALPFAWALSIELGDGFSTYSFSPPDLIINTAGIAVGVLQDQVPYLQHFKFKFSYYPSAYYMNHNFKGWSLTNDYNGHIYWLSTDVHEILPRRLQQYWPKFLNLSAGYGIDGFAESNDPSNVYHGAQVINYRRRKFCIGLDWNLGAIKTKSRTVAAIRNIADYYHFPAPGLRKTGTGNFEPRLLLLN